MRPLLAFLLLLPASSLCAQAKYDVALVVQQGGREAGREEFSISRTGARSGGTLLTSYARYPAVNPTVRIEATLERTPDLGIAKFQLAVQAPEGNIVILAAGSGTRLIVRSVTRGAETGREMPGGRDIVLLDDGVYSLYGAVADLATPAGARLTAIFPRSGRRASFIARREPGDDPNSVRTQFAGDIVGTMVTDSEGRLVRLELPSAGVVVARATK
ncbi:MAG TPA: hypothetical protein VFS11_09825 [Gemmatimonadales bacterium]|nr:hypothetical protein [Gemmatimonadales bacterium]